MRKMFKYLGMWFLAGPFLSIFIAAKDVWQFFTLLTKLKGCREAKNLDVDVDEEGHDERDEVKIYEQVRQIIINLYFKIRNDRIEEIRTELREETDACGCEERGEECEKHPFPFLDEDDEPLAEFTIDMLKKKPLVEVFDMDADFIAENAEIFSIKAKDIEGMWVA